MFIEIIRKSHTWRRRLLGLIVNPNLSYSFMVFLRKETDCGGLHASPIAVNTPWETFPSF